MQKFNTNHDQQGKFSGGASMRQGTGSAPTTHTQTRGEKWYRMGAKDKEDAEVLGRKHAAADYHAKAYAAIHDPTNAEHRIKLAELQSKAEGLADQLAAAKPDQEDTTRSFKQQIPKRGKMKHDKLIASMVNHVHAVKDATISNGKERKLIPESTHPKVATRAYHHGALIAMHRSGVGKYDWAMSPSEKVQMTPLKHFIIYTHRRLFDEFHAQHKGAFHVYKEQFGEPFADHRKDSDGNERKKFSPVHEVIKFEEGDLQKVLPEYDRAVAMAHAYGPKLLLSIKKELKGSIKESDAEASKIAPGLKKGIGSWIGGAIGGAVGGVATDGVGAAEGAEEGSKIGGGIGDILSGAKAAFQGSRASAGIGAVIRGAQSAASPVVGQGIKMANSKPVKVAGKAFDAVGDVAKHPFERGLGGAGKVFGAKGATVGGKIGSKVDSLNDIASPVLVGAAAVHDYKNVKAKKQQGSL